MSRSRETQKDDEKVKEECKKYKDKGKMAKRYHQNSWADVSWDEMFLLKKFYRVVTWNWQLWIQKKNIQMQILMVDNFSHSHLQLLHCVLSTKSKANISQFCNFKTFRKSMKNKCFLLFKAFLRITLQLTPNDWAF